MLLMSTNNICFYGEMVKIFLELASKEEYFDDNSGIIFLISVLHKNIYCWYSVEAPLVYTHVPLWYAASRWQSVSITKHENPDSDLARDGI